MSKSFDRSFNGAQLMDKVFYYASYLSGLSLQYISVNLEFFTLKGNQKNEKDR